MQFEQKEKEMNGERRRNEILKAIQTGGQPVSGSELSKMFQVSRPGNRTGYCPSAGGRLRYWINQQRVCLPFGSVGQAGF
jgi:hypothetical protein